MLILLSAIIPAIYIYGCGLVEYDVQTKVEQNNEEQLNTMSVILNDSLYILTGADCLGGYNPLGILPTCKGALLNDTLRMSLKFGDTVTVGTTETSNGYTVTYSVTYDSYKTIRGSGVIAASTYGHNNSTRAKGVFEFDAIENSDTLRFRKGQFDLYVRSLE